LLKPLIPRALGLTIRRRWALCIKKRSSSIWPVLPGSGSPAAGWRGWPEGKKFAFVITHDVEGLEGMQKCQQLMRLEMEMGFRSSFNFIPEGSYSVTEEIRQELIRNGYEVGVHDLKHDGFLYRSRKQFRINAQRINYYLSKWDAVGFRSGFMLHKLDWLHDLNVVYDASTFDTDPFEPQPDGFRTIFPFHVKKTGDKEGPGYIELPYTLPQDSTLFLLLKEKNTSIWQLKLDWIAEHGGLALINIHPDYIDFSGNKFSSFRYPANMVRELLGYVSEKYKGMFWNPLARELAVWYRKEVSQTTAALPESPSVRHSLNHD